MDSNSNETIIKENNVLKPDMEIGPTVSEITTFPEAEKTEDVESVVEEETVEELEDDVCDCDEVDEEDIDVSSIKISGNEWVNEDLVPVSKIKVLVPRKLLNAIRDIESCVNRKFSGRPEFSIYIHGEYDNKGRLVVAEDFYIPKQEVAGASVDYKEAPEEYYNGCLHKHPDGCKSFSGTDKRYINSNFEFSLLYVCGKLHTGIVNINYAAKARIQVGVDIDIVEDEVNGINIDNIFEPQRKVITGFVPQTTTPKVTSFDHKTPPLLPGFEMNNGVILPHCVRDDDEEDIEELESENDLGFDYLSHDPEFTETHSDKDVHNGGFFGGIV